MSERNRPSDDKVFFQCAAVLIACIYAFCWASKQLADADWYKIPTMIASVLIGFFAAVIMASIIDNPGE